MEEIKKLIEEADDKFLFIANKQNILNKGLNATNLLELINTYLSDEEKRRCLNVEYLISISPSFTVKLFKSINDENIRFDMISTHDLIHNYNFETFHIKEIIDSFSDKNKKVNLFRNKELISSSGIDNSYIRKNIESFKLDCNKIEIMQLYELNDSQVSGIVSSFKSFENKANFLFDNKHNLSNTGLTDIIKSFTPTELGEFFNGNKEFFKESDIPLHKIFRSMPADQVEDYIYALDSFDCDDLDRVKIIASLPQKSKGVLESSKINPKYAYALDIVANDFGKIKVDFSNDLNIYKGLGDMILPINPTNFSLEERKKFSELCNFFPDMSVKCNLGIGVSTGKEYVSSERWIEDVLSNIDSDWSDIKKIAFIDHMIGKKISYSPDFSTEVEDQEGARALWKIIDSGYGVCNGIANVEKYLLYRIGIDSETISSGHHSFIKLPDFEFKDTDGNFHKGDTILDPTWNLAAQRFNGRPQNFCVSYDTIRKHDIDDSGLDRQCHKNDEKLSSATLEVDDATLRNVYNSLGLTDRDGNFPIKELIDKSDNSFNKDLSIYDNIKIKLDLLKEYCPEFATCQSSSMDILSGILLDDKNLNINDCVVDRAFRKGDLDKKPTFYIYLNLKNDDKFFYVVSDDEFREMSLEEFEKNYDSYEKDIEKNNGFRPWEKGAIHKSKDLAMSSGDVVADKGDER